MISMIRIRQVKIKVLEDNEDKWLEVISRKLRIKKSNIIKVVILKKSIDARDKNNIYFVYEFNVLVKNENEVLKKVKSEDISIYLEPKLEITKGVENLDSRIVIVGAGPAGLFASYLLSEYGYHPLIIEQGKMVEERIVDVEKFWKENILDLNSNVQFGEGGAGTFSDGKLNTLIKDKENLKQKVLEIFVTNKAPKEIMYLANPHIGTDNLRVVIKNMRENIIKMGGEFRFQTKLTNLIIEDKKLVGIEVNNKEIIKTKNLILAIGHSARDTFQMLLENKLEIIPKPFAVGVRVMHNASLINENQYGKFSKYLTPASYKLTYTSNDKRGVYSFCMCPGGYVVNAASEKKRLVVNGMSNYKRDTKVSNSAIVVTVSSKDYGNDTLDGVKFQRELESLAYNLGHGKIPIQLLKDFKSNQKSTSLGKIIPVTKGEYELANLRSILPSFIVNSILEAIIDFDKKIPGFASDDTILAGVETRTSSPIRIVRDMNFQSNIKGIYPCGEGAGYAGGITSSAIDGLKIAKYLISKYQNN